MRNQSIDKPGSKCEKSARKQDRFVDRQAYFSDMHSNREIYEECCTRLEDPNLSSDRRDFFQNRKDYYDAHPDLLDRPIEFEAQVKIDVDHVVSKGLNKGIENFGIKLEQVAVPKGLSIAWLSDKVSYSTAHFNRICNGKSVEVPEKLLAELCFLCKTDPYRILGLDQGAAVDQAEIPLIKPLSKTDPAVDHIPHYILDALCVPGDQEKFVRLQLIIKIARLKVKKYEILLNMLENIPLVSNMLKKELPSVSDLSPFMWMSSGRHFSAEEFSLMSEAFKRLDFHRWNDLERLFFLAKLANAGDDVWVVLKAILITGGFPASRNSYLD